MAIPFNYAISNNGTITCNIDCKFYSFNKDHPYYDKVKEALKNKDTETIVKFGDLPKTVASFSENNIEVKDGNVYYKSKLIVNSLTKRILKLLEEGFDCSAMVKFLENLMQNPSYHAVQELFNFLQNRNLPITEDGCFLGYKRVTDDLLDIYSQTVKNEVGSVISMPRNEVNDDWRTECSSGYHVGSIEYVNNYYAGNGKILIVKVNPKDVVACEGEFQKCRTCEYTVCGFMDEELVKSVYEASREGSKPSEPKPCCHTQSCCDDDDEDDDNWDDDLDDDDDWDDDDDIDDDDFEDDDDDWDDDDDEDLD